MLEEEYAPRRKPPAHARRVPAPEPDFSYTLTPASEQDVPDVVSLSAAFAFGPLLALGCVGLHRASPKWSGRPLTQIAAGFAFYDRAEVKDLVDRLMGTNPAHRFAFIQENAARLDEEAIDA